MTREGNATQIDFLQARTSVAGQRVGRVKHEGIARGNDGLEASNVKKIRFIKNKFTIGVEVKLRNTPEITSIKKGARDRDNH